MNSLLRVALLRIKLVGQSGQRSANRFLNVACAIPNGWVNWPLANLHRHWSLAAEDFKQRNLGHSLLYFEVFVGLRAIASSLQRLPVELITIGQSNAFKEIDKELVTFGSPGCMLLGRCGPCFSGRTEMSPIRIPVVNHGLRGCSANGATQDPTSIESQVYRIQSLYMVRRQARLPGCHENAKHVVTSQRFVACAFNSFLGLHSQDRSHDCSCNQQPFVRAHVRDIHLSVLDFSRYVTGSVLARCLASTPAWYCGAVELAVW